MNLFKLFKSKQPKDNIRKGPKIAGHQFFVTDYPLQNSTLRKLAFNKAWREASLSVSEEDLIVYAEGLIEAVNDKDMAKVGWIAQTLKAQIDLHITKENVFKMGACLILIDNEPIEKMTVRHYEQKKLMFETVDEVEAFFLTIVEAIFQNINKLSKATSFADYLKSPEVIKTVQHSRNLLAVIGKDTKNSQSAIRTK